MTHLRYAEGYRRIYNYAIPRMVLHEIVPLEATLRGRKNIVALDVGANQGLWSKSFLDVFGPRVASLCMVEPLDGNNAIIDTRMTDGFFHFPEKVSRLKCAAGSSNTTAEINYDVGDSTLASLALSESVFGQRRVQLNKTQTVEVKTIESVMESQGITGSVDVMKIDTEGFELEILKGASRLLAEKRIGVIPFEFGLNQIRLRQTFHDFWELFNGHGYRMFRFNPTGFYRATTRIPKYSTEFEDFSKNWTLCAVAPEYDQPPSRL
jgi:FkbM family methyltransferase